MQPLNQISTLPPDTFSKEKCDKRLSVYHHKLFELQNLFFADGKFGLLILFQGLDTSGKDSTIRHVMTCMNPMGIQVTSFKEPSLVEASHDFLWRLYPHFPAKGMIQVFNRSYYEDILVPSVHHSLSPKELHRRCQFLNSIEDHLQSSNIHILKFFLHVSKKEQHKRIKERLALPEKNWKYDKTDKATADKWDEYMKIYDTIITSCSQLPWHIIPSDKRWYRNYAVAQIITEHLQSLPLQYPRLKRSLKNK